MVRKINIIEQKIETLIEEKVNKIMREILSDPDFGSEFTESFIKRINKSIKSKKKGKVIDLEKVLKKYKV
jgi:hypothetical protein